MRFWPNVNQISADAKEQAIQLQSHLKTHAKDNGIVEVGVCPRVHHVGQNRLKRAPGCELCPVGQFKSDFRILARTAQPTLGLLKTAPIVRCRNTKANLILITPGQ